MEEKNNTDKQSLLSTTDRQTFPSIAEFTKNGLGLIVEATKAVNSFPSGASRDLYCAYPTFGKIVEQQSDRILGIISNVLKKQNIRGNIQLRQQDEQVELLLECNDVMLERINSNLDELAGIKKNPETILVETQLSTNTSSPNRSGSWNSSIKRVETAPIVQASARLLTAKNIARPQVNFKVPVDNSASNPFIPKIKDKPNSLKPLAILPEYDEDGNIACYLHPYEFELVKFEPSQDRLIKLKEVKKPLQIDKTPLVHVNDEQSLQNLIYDLQNSKEFAVDLEHHSYRTFQGITCLMQISTRHKDYIIDALKLREELHILNNVFTNPKILKIFHGAASDIEWLQRDLALYVVNMFDTSQASKLLGFPRLSLAYLLKHYCNIEADKTFQLADWRIRPLPLELISYARQDTHYLIYIYESLRNDLIKHANGETNLLKTVYLQSTELCKKRYCKPTILPESHLDLYRKSKRIFDNRQLFALKELFAWRDKIARMEDESYGYVLPNHMMLQISESLPREMQGILACCNPIPPLVRQNLHILHQIILKAREQPLVKPIIDEQIVNREVTILAKDFNSKLYCPHDLSRNAEFRDDLPTLLSSKKSVNVSTISLAKPVLSVFDTSPTIENQQIRDKLCSLKKIKFVSPYERYKAVIPFVEQQQLEEIAKETALNTSKQLCPTKPEPEEPEKNIIKVEKEKEYTIPPKKELKRKRPDPPNVEESKVESKKSKPTENKNQTTTTSNSNETKQTAQQTTSQINNNRNKRKNNKRKKPQPNNKPEQNSSQPVQFDYSKVDFKKFQGGSQNKTKETEIKTKFQGKGSGNRANNKKFNKLFSFSNSKNK